MLSDALFWDRGIILFCTRLDIALSWCTIGVPLDRKMAFFGVTMMLCPLEVRGRGDPNKARLRLGEI